MVLVGYRLVKAWNDFINTKSVHIREIEDDPEILSFLGDCYVYEVSRETSDVLLPLMQTEYKGSLEYNGTEYCFEGHVAEVEQLHRNGKRYWRFMPGAEEIRSILRLKSMIEIICVDERERWEKATAKK